MHVYVCIKHNSYKDLPSKHTLAVILHRTIEPPTQKTANTPNQRHGNKNPKTKPKAQQPKTQQLNTKEHWRKKYINNHNTNNTNNNCNNNHNHNHNNNNSNSNSHNNNKNKLCQQPPDTLKVPCGASPWESGPWEPAGCGCAGARLSSTRFGESGGIWV